jgi:nucleotide-binding universal stress UspA family protein
MKTIIAATDFSPNSENAVYYAADMAIVLGAELHLLHVYSVPIPVSEVPIPVVDAKEIEEDATDQLVKLSNKLLARANGKLFVQTELRSGNITWEIEEYCRQIHPYAVVMGAETNGPVERMLFGGKTLSAISKLDWPVLVIPEGVSFKALKKIGLACDFRKVIDTIPVNEITDLINEFNAELHVLHVSMDSSDEFAAETVTESGWLQEILEDLHPKYHFIQDENTDTAIARFADQNNIDLLIVVPKKHGILNRIFEHSHSKNLVLHSHVPVLSIHE